MNVKDGIGISPLHDAYSEGHKEIVELKISKGADVNVKFDYGINVRTALDIATSCLWRRPEIASLLQKTELRQLKN